MMKYRIDQLEIELWRLSEMLDSGWRQVSTHASEEAAVAALNALVANRDWAAPPPKYFDGTGTSMANSEGDSL
jgi:hypothetical protein